MNDSTEVKFIKAERISLKTPTRGLAGSNPCMGIWLLWEWIVLCSAFLRVLVGAGNNTMSTVASALRPNQ